MARPICLITGVGSSTGAALARRFAAGVFRVAMIARNAELLPALEQEIEAGNGAIMVAGTTAPHRGAPNYALFAPAKAAQRFLAEAW